MNKVPKYVYDAIKKREKHTEFMVHYDSIISKFINKHNICAEDYINLSAVTIGEPFVAREALETILQEYESEVEND